MADRDKTARAGAIHDKIAEEAADDNTIDPSIELAVDRVGEEANEIIVIDSTTETIIDKIAEEAAELAVDTSIEAILVAEERVDEFSVDPLIEAIQSRGTIDEEAEGPRFESSPH